MTFTQERLHEKLKRREEVKATFPPSLFLKLATVNLTKDSKFDIICHIITYDIKSDSITKARKSDSVSDLRAFRHFKEVFKCSILQKSFER